MFARRCVLWSARIDPPMSRVNPPATQVARVLRRVASVCLLSVLCLLPGGAPYAQQGNAQQSGPVHPRPGIPGPFSDSGLDDPRFEARRLKALNEHRQKQVISDAEKLVRATQRLQHEIAEQQPDRLNPTQLRELADIEKLARSVRENMTNMPGGGSPAMSVPGLQR